MVDKNILPKIGSIVPISDAIDAIRNVYEGRTSRKTVVTI